MQSVEFPPIRTELEGGLVTLATATMSLSIPDLRKIEQTGKEQLKALADLDEFHRISVIAGKRAEVVKAELRLIVSDAPYIKVLSDSIEEVQKAQKSGSLKIIQQSLADLEQNYRSNKNNLDRDRFASP